jgi:2-haloacid dehalogenase
MIEAVVLDIGNVLIRWDPEGFYDERIGPERRQRLFAEVALADMNQRIDQGAPFRKTVAEVAKAHPQWHDEIMLWHDEWLGMTAPDRPRMIELTRAVRANGTQVWALSNFGIETLELADAAYPFLAEFDRRIISGELGVCKPAPDIFEAVEAQGVAPERLLYTDDVEENVAAAAARGWQTHLFDGVDGWEARLVAEGLLKAAAAS